jgi:drug/metabolite transporter (DMT)-like permease
MIRLIVVSLVWAFSFGIVKTYLPAVDASFVSWARLFLALLVFLPFLVLFRGPGVMGRDVRRSASAGGFPDACRLMFLGAVQYGLMYLLYLHAFQYLKAYQIAFFTVFTPLYVTLFNDLLDWKLRRLFLVAAGLAVLGTAVISYRQGAWADLRMGFLLVQGSNLCFAVGQILYKRGFGIGERKERNIFGWLFLGATLTTLLPAGFSTGWAMPQLDAAQGVALVYLGVVASGLCFFLWNSGARQVNAGTLAVMNNLKVPLAAWVSILVFRESADMLRALVGTVLVVGALWLNESRREPDVVRTAVRT